jgi:predicted MPP superfamily phosphohydrolase
VTTVLGLIEGLTAFGGAIGGYSLLEAQNFTTRNLEIEVLPVGHEPIKLLHLSDLHLTPSQTRKINWLRSLEKLQPDLVVVTGDFLAHPLAVAAVAEALDSLLDVPGLFVFGSNDYFGPEMKNPLRYFDRNRAIEPHGKVLPTSELRELLTDAGWHDLNNNQVRITIRNSAIHARGTDDAHIDRDDYNRVAGPFDSGALALGVIHSPYRRVTQAFAQDNAQLILAGHTHGGQVCVPMYGALVTNCDLPRNQAKGLSQVSSDTNQSLLHVSAGVGTSPFTPVRLSCRPEATLLNLTPRAS